MRICNIGEGTYDKLQSLIQSRDHTELSMYVLRLVNKSSDDTEIVDLSHSLRISNILVQTDMKNPNSLHVQMLRHPAVVLQRVQSS
jgi:hypothetical protein